MIDLVNLRQLAAGSSDEVIVTRHWLTQAADEIAAGRQAAADLRAETSVRGLVFGLKPGQRL